MGKKGKKGGGKKGGKGKGGKEGKGGKKGKKEKKTPASKMDKAKGQLDMAAKASTVWQFRTNQADDAKDYYRKQADSWMLENKWLQKQMEQVEHDTIDVISFLKQQDLEKERKVETMERELNTVALRHKEESDKAMSEWSTRVKGLEEVLGERQRELEWLQTEMKAVREFRRQKDKMQKDLDEIKEALFVSETEHKTTMQQLEQKFLEEKVRLKQEADQKIAELADRAHQEAIANLSHAAKDVFKENIRMNAALTYHVNQEKELAKNVNELGEENEELKDECETNESVITRKVAADRRQKQKIKDFEAKVKTLEAVLSHVTREFEGEKETLERRYTGENETDKQEVVRLKRMMTLRERELTKVKRLAAAVLAQRTDVERFFLDSLEHVKGEITSHQAQYKRAAEQAYNNRMQAAFAGQSEYPKVRTFAKNGTSTNSVYKDLQAAERLLDAARPVDIADLTWEQKEKVLRYLFARMNRHTEEPAARPAPRAVLPPIAASPESGHISPDGGSTFLTQQLAMEQDV